MLCSASYERRKKTGYTAQQLQDPQVREKIQLTDDGYLIFRHVQNTPSYFEDKKKKVWAMIRQLGYPTIFFSLSAADTNWPELLHMLGWQVDQKEYTDDHIANVMSWDDKCCLVREHPTACSHFFHEHVQMFLKTIILTDHSPFGLAAHYMYCVKFQQ